MSNSPSLPKLNTSKKALIKSDEFVSIDEELDVSSIPKDQKTTKSTPDANEPSAAEKYIDTSDDAEKEHSLINSIDDHRHLENLSHKDKDALLYNQANSLASYFSDLVFDVAKRRADLDAYWTSSHFVSDSVFYRDLAALEEQLQVFEKEAVLYAEQTKDWLKEVNNSAVSSHIKRPTLRLRDTTSSADFFSSVEELI